MKEHTFVCCILFGLGGVVVCGIRQPLRHAEGILQMPRAQSEGGKQEGTVGIPSNLAITSILA